MLAGNNWDDTLKTDIGFAEFPGMPHGAGYPGYGDNPRPGMRRRRRRRRRSRGSGCNVTRWLLRFVGL